ncbi:MAG: VOC family protein [Candidatus Abawacabacteria bacterium]|nr:VOC family protein [Candidatus Abawacabacteria bacterium]
MNRPIHFEVHAENPERAMQFYQTMFGWQFQKWGEVPYWIVTTGPKEEAGIDGGLMPRKAPINDTCGVIAYVCTMEVSNVDEMTEKALKNGGQMALEKMPIPGMGWLVYCKDTEGNIFGMMQNDPKAA